MWASGSYTKEDPNNGNTHGPAVHGPAVAVIGISRPAGLATPASYLDLREGRPGTIPEPDQRDIGLLRRESSQRP
eukprot:9261956-Heterocapsa_arctica.AAC.1